MGGTEAGDRGDAVVQVQAQLLALGLLEPTPDALLEVRRGFFGEQTRAAVRRFQESTAIEVTGTVDPVTVTGLEREAGDVCIVSGVVRTTSSLPVAAVTVRAVDRTGGAEATLAENVTGADGSYRIAFGSGPERPAPAVIDVRVVGTDGAMLTTSPLILRPSANQAVDFVIKPVTSELDHLRAALGDVDALGAMDPAQLDVVAATHGIDRSIVGSASAAVRLAAVTPAAGQPIPVELAYAALRTADGPVDGASAAPVAVAIEQAVSARLIPAAIVDEHGGPAEAAGAVIGALAAQQRAERSAATFARLTAPSELAGVAPIGALLLRPGIEEAQVAALLVHVEDHVGQTGDAAAVWAAVAGDPALAASAPVLRFASAAAAVAGGSAPVVDALFARVEAGAPPDPTRIARMQSGDWTELVAGIPDEQLVIPPGMVADPSADQRAAFARALERNAEAQFPREYSLARLAPRSAALGAFAEAAPGDFDLAMTPLQDLDLPADDRVAVLDELRPMQRLTRLGATIDEAGALRAAGFDSAFAIARRSGHDFADAMAGAIDDRSRAHRLHGAAAQAAASSLHLVTALLGAGDTTGDLAVTGDAGVPVDLPAYAEMFGGLSLCQCDDCQSVFSPAAHLVDLLGFLEARNLPDGTTFLRALLDLRPDLAHVMLTCDNTKVELPYIDLALELLEAAAAEVPSFATAQFSIPKTAPSLSAELVAGAAALEVVIAPDVELVSPPLEPSAWYVAGDIAMLRVDGSGPTTSSVLAFPQTTASDRSRRIAPQHRVNAAYATLAESPYPWLLPFDLATESIREALHLVDLDQADVVEALMPPAPDAAATDRLSAARLGVAPAALDALRGTGTATLATRWGEPDPPAPTWVSDLTDHVPALLTRTGLTYEQLLELVALPLVQAVAAGLAVGVRDTGAPVTVDQACDIESLALGAVPDPADDLLELVERLLTLARATGWGLRSVAAAVELATGGDGVLDGDALVALAGIVGGARHRADGPDAYLAELAAGVAPGSLGGSLGAVAAAAHAATYLAPRVPAVSAAGERRPLALLLDHGGQPIAPYLPADRDPADLALVAIMAKALRTTPADVEAIVTLAKGATGLSAFLRLRAWAALCARHSCALRDAPTLVELGLLGDPFSGPAALADAERRLATLARVGLSADQLDHGLRAAENGVAKAAAGLVANAVEAVRAAHAATTPPAEAPSDAATRAPRATLLAALRSELGPAGWSAVQVDALVAAAGQWAEATTPADQKKVIVPPGPSPAGLPRAVEVPVSILAGVEAPSTLQGRVTIDQHNGLIRLDGALTPVELALLEAASDDTAYRAAVTLLNPTNAMAAPLFAGLGPEQLNAALTTLLVRRRAELVVAAVAALVDLPPPQVRELLAVEVGQDLTLLSWLLDPANVTGPLLADRLARLARIGAMAPVFGSDLREVFWYRRGKPGERFIDIVLTGTAVLSSLVATLGEALELRAVALDWASSIASTPALLDPTATAPELRLPTTTAGDRLAQLFPETPDPAAVEALAAAPMAAGTIAALAIRLRMAGAIGSTMAELDGWIASGDLAAADAIAARVEATHTAEDWETAGAAMLDRLRIRRRDALVAHLAHRDGISPADVSSRLLIDVLMQPGEITTRIRQALNSVQLFVQRCQLGLEGPAMRPDPKLDRGWEQWIWVGRYRVWEAQRRTFCYPENYVEPDMRSGRSAFFRDLETDLLQSDLDAASSEDAFRSYLDKLHRFARPHVLGYFRDRVASTTLGVTRDVLHVVARSATSPYEFGYRTLDDGIWTPWEPIPCDIDPRQALPVVWNGRLFVFWLIAVPTPPPPAAQTGKAADQIIDTTKPGRVTVRLAWSERRHGKWLAKQVTDETAVVEGASTAEPAAGLRIRSMQDALVLGLTRTDPDLSEASVFDGSAFVVRAGGVTVESIGGIGRAAPPTAMGYQSGHLTGGSLSVVGPDAGTILSVMSRASVALESSQPALLPDAEFFVDDGVRSYFAVPGTYWAKASKPDLTGIDVPVIYHKPTKEEMVTIDEIRFTNPAVQLVRTTLGDRALDDVTFRVAEPFVSTPGGALALAGTLALPSVSVRDLTLTELGGVIPTTPMSTMSITTSADEFFGVAKARLGFDAYQELVAGILVRPAPRFAVFYHPYSDVLIEQLYSGGVPRMLARLLQCRPDLATGQAPFDFKASYQPTDHAATPYPVESIDFDSFGAYSSYNWELFFHAPYLVATRLWSNHQHDDALRWLSFIFDPTDQSMLPGDAPDAVRSRWQTKPFYERSFPQQRADRIEALLANPTDSAFQKQVQWWRTHPFDPHSIAGLRLSAYQKAVFMRCLDILVGAGDQHFAAGTSEELNLAYQYYAYAAELLGERPPRIEGPGPATARSFRTLGASYEGFSNAMVAAEHLAVPMVGVAGGPELPATIASLATLPFFCVPANDKLAGYWDLVADRQFKLRNSLDLQGNVRVTDLWGRQLDPGAIARLLAAGLSLEGALAELSAPPPRHRFHTLLAKALDLAQEARQLGQAVLAAIERSDAERLSTLRTTHEVAALDRLTQVRQLQFTAAEVDAQAAGLAKASAVTRRDHFAALLAEDGNAGAAAGEAAQIDKVTAASNWNLIGSTIDAAAGFLFNVPEVGAGPWIAGATFGGSQMGAAGRSLAGAAHAVAALHQAEGTKAGLRAGLDRRRADWQHQLDLAVGDEAHLELVRVAAETRRDTVDREYANHVQQLTEAQAVLQVVTERFTNAELFSWMVRQLGTLHREMYNLAVRLARQAERAWHEELLVRDQVFIRPGVWNSERKGLLAAEQLVADLKAMDAAYLDHDDRPFELTKAVSLRLLDPAALADLVRRGTASFSIPEWVFDLDHPGHYQRRLQDVAVTIPCITGPYSGVNAVLHLDDDRIRLQPTDLKDDGLERTARAGGSIVISHGQEDTGRFSPGADDHLLPFEHAGAISRWTLTLDPRANAFDVSTVSDVVLRLRYTARADHELAAKARTRLDEILQRDAVAAAHPTSSKADWAGGTELSVLVDLRAEHADDWARNAVATTPIPFRVPITTARLPYALRGGALKVTGVALSASGSGTGRVTVGDTSAKDLLGREPISVAVDVKIGAEPSVVVELPTNATSGVLVVSLAPAAKA